MAGTVVLTRLLHTGDQWQARFLCTADSADGSYPATEITALSITTQPGSQLLSSVLYGTLQAIETNPGAVAPTDNYDITLVDADGADRLNGVGANRDTANTERIAITGASNVLLGETLTLTIINNSVNSATIEFMLYWTNKAGAGSSSATSDATAANQTSEIALLTTIDGDTNNLELGVKLVDNVAGATDRGYHVLAVRDDALATLTEADGDYTRLRTDSTGALWVNAGTGVAQYAEDAPHVSADVGSFVLAVRNDTPTARTSTDGDYSPFSVDQYGQQIIINRATTSVANGQAAIGNTAATIVAARVTRGYVTIKNTTGPTCYVGIATVTTANGFALDVGEAITIAGDDLIQGITASGTATMAYIENY